MYHYICNIVNSSEVISNREPIIGGAGLNRVLYICNAINNEVNIVSMGAGARKGFFKKEVEEYSSKIKIVYLQQWHFTIFKKKLRHVFYSFFLLIYLFKNVKKNDKLILYNSSKSFFMIMPVILFNFFRNIKYILEIEELYSYKREKIKLSFSERVSIKYASAFIFVNSNIKKFLVAEKPGLLNVGYFSFNTSRTIDIKKNIKKSSQILYSGRLDEESGIEIFLDSLRFITAKCTVVITGKGILASYVNKFENLNPLVDFKYLGILNEQEYHELLLNSRIAINPIRVKNDFADVSFPSKLLQYLAYGIKVVSSNINAMDVLDNLKEYVKVYEDDSSERLAAQINLLLKEPVADKKIIIDATKKYFDLSTLQLKEFLLKN